MDATDARIRERYTLASLDEELMIIARARMTGERVSDHHVTGRLRSRAMATADILRDIRPLEEAAVKANGGGGTNSDRVATHLTAAGLSSSSARGAGVRSRDFEALRMLLLEIAWYWLSRYENRHVGVNYDLRQAFANGDVTASMFKDELARRTLDWYKDETIHRALCAFVWTLTRAIARLIARAADTASRHAAVVSSAMTVSDRGGVAGEEEDDGVGLYIGQSLRRLLQRQTRVTNAILDKCKRTYGGDTPYLYTRLDGAYIACPRIGMARSPAARV
jgi:hypothetical protein